MCNICSYYKYHNNEMISPAKHFTCLCELFQRKYICCRKGYSSLLRKIPNFVVYAPNAEVINSYYIQNAENYSPSNKSILENLSCVYEEKVDVLQSQNYLFQKIKYYNNGKK